MPEFGGAGTCFEDRPRIGGAVTKRSSYCSKIGRGLSKALQLDNHRYMSGYVIRCLHVVRFICSLPTHRPSVPLPCIVFHKIIKGPQLRVEVTCIDIDVSLSINDRRGPRGRGEWWRVGRDEIILVYSVCGDIFEWTEGMNLHKLSCIFLRFRQDISCSQLRKEICKLTSPSKASKRFMSCVVKPLTTVPRTEHSSRVSALVTKARPLLAGSIPG